MPIPVKLINLFFSKVNRSNIEDCWEWIGAKYPSGYGAFGWAYKQGFEQRAHRFAWELFFEPIPEGWLILHKCNNRSCVNPNHLYLGNTQQNTRDRMLFGNHCYGIKIGNHKLNEEQVKSIFHDTRAYRAIARDYGVFYNVIRSIKRGRTWKHLNLLPEITN